MIMCHIVTNVPLWGRYCLQEREAVRVAGGGGRLQGTLRYPFQTRYTSNICPCAECQGSLGLQRQIHQGKMILILRDLGLYGFLRKQERLKLKEDLAKQRGHLTKYAKPGAFFSKSYFYANPRVLKTLVQSFIQHSGLSFQVSFSIPLSANSQFWGWVRKSTRGASNSLCQKGNSQAQEQKGQSQGAIIDQICNNLNFKENDGNGLKKKLGSIIAPERKKRGEKRKFFFLKDCQSLQQKIGEKLPFSTSNLVTIQLQFPNGCMKTLGQNLFGDRMFTQLQNIIPQHLL